MSSLEQPIRVLLVENDERDYILTRDLLTSIDPGGFTVEWVRTPDAARAALVRGDHDVYLVNHHHGDDRALGFVEEAQRHGLDAPIIVLGNHESREADLRAMRAGAAYYLAKSDLDAQLLERTVRYSAQTRQAQQALREAEEQTRAILDSAVDGMITIDEQGRIETFNPAAQWLFGYTAEEAIGENVRMLMPAPYRHDHDAFLARYLQTGERRIIGLGREVTGLRHDGSVFPIDLAVSEVVIGGRRTFLGITRDLTERKQAEARFQDLEMQSRRQERLADIGANTAEIVHDLGNPLAAMSAQAQLVLHRARRDETQPVGTVVKQIEGIMAEIKRLDILVREFLDFSREQRLDRQPIAVVAFLRDIVESWRPLAIAREVTLRVVEPTGGCPAIMGDDEKLRRVFENLVKNAIEAIDRGPGLVVLRPSCAGHEHVRVAVEDTGPGMLPHIEPFKLFESSKPCGTGLGLPIARQIVLAHGGRIDLVAREGGGTTVVIDLPRVRPDQNP